MDQRVEKLNAALAYITERTGGLRPAVGIVLGSGLGKLADRIEDPVVIPYKDIPSFPVSTAIGHKGNFIIGTLAGKTVIAMQGRFHYYEGYPMQTVTAGIAVMNMLGVKHLFVSNAAGGCNPGYKVGDLVIIRDHISLMPNPLIGPNIDGFGPRFVDMTCAYDLEMQALAEKVAGELSIELKKGVYLGSTGPTYETPAEVRFFHSIGADLLGMSTIPEVIAARYFGIRVFGMSVVTNISNISNVAHNLNDGDDVIRQADLAADKMSELFRLMIAAI